MGFKIGNLVTDLDLLIILFKKKTKKKTLYSFVSGFWKRIYPPSESEAGTGSPWHNNLPCFFQWHKELQEAKCCIKLQASCVTFPRFKGQHQVAVWVLTTTATHDCVDWICRCHRWRTANTLFQLTFTVKTKGKVRGAGVCVCGGVLLLSGIHTERQRWQGDQQSAGFHWRQFHSVRSSMVKTVSMMYRGQPISKEGSSHMAQLQQLACDSLGTSFNEHMCGGSVEQINHYRANGMN